MVRFATSKLLSVDASSTRTVSQLPEKVDPSSAANSLGSSADATVVGEAVARIKRHTRLPVCVGFGIRTPDAARAIAENANGAVVGTALVDALRGTLDAEDRATPKTVGAIMPTSARMAARMASVMASRQPTS